EIAEGERREGAPRRSAARAGAGALPGPAGNGGGPPVGSGGRVTLSGTKRAISAGFASLSLTVRIAFQTPDSRSDPVRLGHADAEERGGPLRPSAAAMELRYRSNRMR